MATSLGILVSVLRQVNGSAQGSTTKSASLQVHQSQGFDPCQIWTVPNTHSYLIECNC